MLKARYKVSRDHGRLAIAPLLNGGISHGHRGYKCSKERSNDSIWDHADVIITHPWWLRNHRNSLWERWGEKKAPFLLKWLKCGITSLKEVILDGAESKQTRKTKREVLMLKCERKLRAHCLGLQLSGNDLSFLWNPIRYVFLITPESTHLLY